MMRVSPSILSTLLVGGHAIGVHMQRVPDVVCREGRVVRIDPVTLASTEGTGEAVYRISAGALFITEPGREEYRYNTVSPAISPGVVTSANFTIVSRNRTFEGPVSFVHADAQRIAISLTACSRQAKQ